jgi:AraC-like DNA-binding protein
MIDWVEMNLMEDPSLEKMSSYVGYSAFYCSSKFHEVVGISFKEYVVKRKLTLAANDLLNTKCNIIEVAVKYGFSSNEAFTRSFYKTYHCTPIQFRKTIPSVEFYRKPQIG